MKKICAVLLAAVFMIFAAVPAFALNSPIADLEYDVVIDNTEGGKGSYTAELIEDKKQAIITAHPKDGYTFSHWIIDGEYVIIEGSLKDEQITIELNSDVVAKPHFEKDGKPGQPGPDEDDGPVSPQTGDFNSYPMLLLAGAFIVMIASVGIKIAVSKK